MCVPLRNMCTSLKFNKYDLSHIVSDNILTEVGMRTRFRSNGHDSVSRYVLHRNHWTKITKMSQLHRASHEIIINNKKGAKCSQSRLGARPLPRLGYSHNAKH